MKIAVIGGGIFGTTTAIKLSESGFNVELFEKLPNILSAASGINQYRLHRGYHYPRSKTTAISSVVAEPLFKNEYKDAVTTDSNHYYAIAKEGSFVTGEQFLKFCNECNLDYKVSNLSIINHDNIDVVIQAEEELLNPNTLRSLVWEKLKKNNIQVNLNTEVDSTIFDNFDLVINATYANLNFITDRFPEAKKEYQFELCEKVVLKLPDEFKGISLVIMDGPFMCIDPYDTTGFHVMGNVVHAIHHTNTGIFPEIPDEFKPLLNKGIIKNPSITNIDKFIKSASYFMPNITQAEHVGSMYTIRTVLPNVHQTDERPTLVYKVNDQLINVFSGKIGNSVEAANLVLNLVTEIESSS